MSRIGTFAPLGPTKAWNRGKGTPLRCSDCKKDSLMIVIYDDGSVIADCCECGCVWEFVDDNPISERKKELAGKIDKLRPASDKVQ